MPAERRPPRRPADSGASPRLRVIALALVALVGAQWSLSAYGAFRNGIGDADSQHYHLTHAAKFAQSHDLAALHYVSANDAATYHPANAETLHAVGMLAFDNDTLSLVLNLATLPLALLAAWCVGRRFGAGHLALLGSALLHGLPFMGEGYAGSAANDYAALAFFVAAIALLVRLPTGNDADSDATPL